MSLKQFAKGFSFLILSIVLNAILSKEVTANLRVGDKIDFENAKISFSSIKSIKKENYQSIVGSFTIEDKRKILPIFVQNCPQGSEL